MAFVTLFCALGAQAYYLYADITGNSIISSGSFEDSDEISTDEFNNITADGFYVVKAVDEGISGASAHGKVLKRIANSGGTHQFRTINSLVGTAGKRPTGEALEAAKKVVYKADILIDSEFADTKYNFDLRAMMVEKDPSTDAYAESAEGNMLRIEYGNTAPKGGEASGNALEVVSWDGPSSKYRLKVLNVNEWYTFTIAISESEENPGQFVKNIWINDELVAENWLSYQSSSSVKANKVIQFMNGLRVSSNNVDANVYIDNICFWTNGSVNSFAEYDGYDVKDVSVSKADNTAAVNYEITNYMDAARPVVVMAAVYNKNTNKVCTVHHKPAEFVMGKTVKDSIENIILPDDYNEDDYEIRFYVWNRNQPFAPIISSVANN